MMDFKDSFVRKTAHLTFTYCSFQVGLPPRECASKEATLFSKPHEVRILIPRAETVAVWIISPQFFCFGRVFLTVKRVICPSFFIAFDIAKSCFRFAFHTFWKNVELSLARFTFQPRSFARFLFWPKLDGMITSSHCAFMLT